MLREEERLLIAASVEGPLPTSDAATLRVLLADTSEAASLFRKLSFDRDRLIALPKHSAPARIARNVSARIQTKAIPSTLVARPTNRVPSWLPYAFAASILLAVTCGSFVFFNRDSGHGDSAKGISELLILAVEKEAKEKQIAVIPTRETLPRPNVPGFASTITKSEPPKIESHTSPKNPEDWFGARVIGSVPDLDSATARLPYLFNVADAGQDETKKRILTELNQSPAVRIDLFSRDLPKSIEVVQSVARASNLQLAVSALTVEQLKRKLPISVVVYTESCSADELAAIIQKMSLADTKAPSFAQAHLIPASASDSRDLKSLLGLDLGLWKRPKSDTGKPLAEGTLGQITNVMGKGTKPAILLTFGPNLARIAPSLCPEIKPFLERRGERSPSAVPAMIVIRAVN